MHFDVGGDDFYTDLLFFHVEQLRYYVIELKAGEFQPEYAGKLNCYIAPVDDRLRRDAHADTVGILICGDRNDRTVRFSLAHASSAMAVTTYTFAALPPALQHDTSSAASLVLALELDAPVGLAENDA